MGVDHVDPFLIHKPTAHVRDGKSILREVWRGMEEVKRAGLAVSIDVSKLSDGAPGRELRVVTALYSGLSPLTRVPNCPVTPVIEHPRGRLEKTLGVTVTDMDAAEGCRASGRNVIKNPPY
jgi:hypothetical protein